MKDKLAISDEGLRIRIESLERFIAEGLLKDDEFFYCGYHTVHYQRARKPTTSTRCPKAQYGEDRCLIFELNP